MHLLVLGGTVFLGRHLVEAALAQGHTVTLFNRGQHNADLFPEAERLRGDRDGGLDALRGRRWDAVVDTCGYVPRVVRDSATLLADTVGHYTFISSISVYSDFDRPHMDESGPLGTIADPTAETVDGETYGPLKVLCEQAADAAMPARVLTVRPGLIVGPHDPTDRFTYWPVRMAEGGEVLAPGRPEWAVQFIDVRDLAEWTLRLVEARSTGIYNATGPDYALGMGPFLEACIAAAASDARLTWVSEEYLLGAGVAPWSDLPLWVPEEGHAGFSSVNCSKAIAAGLTFRPLAQTIRDTLAWNATRPHDTPPRAGITREREAELLKGWHARA
jgi:2'-hydroxyisoflavone reductase